VTNLQLAVELGVSESLIVRYRKRGMPDDPAGARAWKQANVRTRLAMNQQPPQASLELEQQGGSGAIGMSLSEVDRQYRLARLEREQSLAAQERLRAQELAGQLVRVDAITHDLARRCVTARDHLLYLSDRLATQLAGMGGDAAGIHRLLDEEMRRFLTLFARSELEQIERHEALDRATVQEPPAAERPQPKELDHDEPHHP